MDLLEYQAKALFSEMGIPVLPSQRIDYPKDLKKLKIPYPVVLKSQVHTGERSSLGGIKFVENTIDAVAAAQTIFNLPIKDEYPAVLLAEAKYNADQELYLAVVLDPIVRRPVLLGSKQGGIDTETAIKSMQKVVVNQEFSPFYARRLMVKIGLEGKLIELVSHIVEKMYQLFVEKDLDMIEINPLGISPKGEVMALDGKVSVNDYALGRHPELLSIVGQNISDNYEIKQKEVKEIEDSSLLVFNNINAVSNRKIIPDYRLKFKELQGNIGILCNGKGLTMATVDMVIQAQGKPANFLNIKLGDYLEVKNSLRSQMFTALDLVSQRDNIKVVLINVIGIVETSDELITIVYEYLNKLTSIDQKKIRFVLRLLGGRISKARERLSDLPVEVIENLEDAVSQAVYLSK
ncbi:MAG: succinate--CoA ligase subunit beta [Trichodesmium sp. St16_bin4-tuft]|uniref:Succinyl-CoA synthetase (ADP-forming) beta subunit n=1 Tax=Trichodesmium erythraeum (strain IMS101) TaxID=203124 RepID=Q110Z1_TRIEI|nr:succinate--CoA ligase subunit beta [Trichodesmium erythraeum GBRTRLIN201]MCH2049088.1 succinate--CoA ligase subunit beta [Trichodesmium sp. ALOHA_ZT_67]MDE5078126.1 succinate--CoA ligase subunit beta [Trichodesmium sp. St2_bin6]MDE5094593.1 succinate--CoA ligase subunit beta [Trichodesmium sp. St11_bin5]MDE5097205.1 succinate--CoA ligase subunit beta [Trichodesmium sp. St16_bin4-tuft]MDE5102334.1 succinate--CoA ligase subunit beta [Trichodesmium sp. St19_bin2]